MLKEILSVSGKSGLFKLVSQGKNMIIVESLIDGKRQPIYSSEKVVSLSEIAIYTDNDETPIGKVFGKMKEIESGNSCSIDPKADNDKLRAYFKEVLPAYDQQRVYPSDIRKIINWYNLLVKVELADFSAEEETEETTAE